MYKITLIALKHLMIIAEPWLNLYINNKIVFNPIYLKVSESFKFTSRVSSIAHVAICTFVLNCKTEKVLLLNNCFKGR